MADGTLAVTIAQAGPIPLDVAFTCERGQVLAIFGPSGSGKTTILRTIAGLYTPAGTVVTMDGTTWADSADGIDVPAHQRRLGFVFQDYALFPHLSALGNVMAALGHLPRATRRQRAAELLALVHLADRAERRPAALSGGERQRVALARALAREPRVLLLDEPFAAVDRGLRRALQAEIDGIRRAIDIPIVLVTHDFEDVVRLATHLLLLRGGQSVAQGTLESLTSRPDLPWLRETVGLGTVLDVTVVRVDAARGLAELDAGGPTLLAPSAGLRVGHHARVRIPAREVILATAPPTGLSVHNVLSGVVTSVPSDPGSEAAIVQIGIGATRLLAEVTRDAVARLRLAEGAPVHALVKSVALEVLGTTPAV